MTTAAGPGELAATVVAPLPWDSTLLGRPVARADVAGWGVAEVAALLRAVKGGAADVVYLFGEPADAAAAAALDAAGAAVVDRRTVFVRDVDPACADALPEGVREHAAWPDPALRALAIASGVHSRFRVDPRMPRGVGERLYEIWIQRSVAREIADAVYVLDDGDALAGMVTVGMKGTRADIGLLAVAEGARGRGVGRALVRAANHWAAARGVAVEQVVTQGENLPACRLYARCGYVVESVTPVRHLWRSAVEPPPTGAG